MSNPREAILGLITASGLRPLTATPAGWPEGLALRTPSLRERDQLLEQADRDGDELLVAVCLARLTVDAAGRRVFADEDAHAISELPYDPAYLALARQCRELFGLVGPGPAEDPSKNS